MPRGGFRANAGRPKGSTTRKPAKPGKAFLALLRKSDAHKAVRLLGDKLAEEGQFEAAARTIAKIVRYETSPMGVSRREAPLSQVQQTMFDFFAPEVAAKDPDAPDDFAGLIN